MLFGGCDSSPVRQSCLPVLPELPSHWEDVLGEPLWRVQWIDSTGSWRKWEGPGSELPDLSLPCEWTTPVVAWPFWPRRSLIPGMMRPSGAFFPWDLQGNELILSWKGGVEAVFWRELAEASDSEAERRLPWHFDWIRFRELLESEDVPESVRLDPWLVDWKELGKKTVKSGFDRRRIRPRNFSGLEVPGLEGRWIGSSPFAPPLDAAEDGLLCLQVTESVATWVSSGGILKCSTLGWVYVSK